ncbi:MAG: hypothetical protein HFI63_05540 [Lachnospiraceae bacterium]|nr:hypothetical protein [Lachnospiraceae bacterium]
MAAEETKGREETAVEEAATESAETKAVETTGAAESTTEETKDSAESTVEETTDSDSEITTEAEAESTETESTDEAESQETETSNTETTDVETTAATEEESTEVENSEESKKDGEALDTYADGEIVVRWTETLDFFRLSEGGNWLCTETLYVERQGTADVTLKELGVSFPEMKPGYKGIKQIGWADEEGNLVSENTKFSGTTFTAVYEKVPIRVQYSYQDENGEKIYKDSFFLVSSDATCGDIKAMLEKEAVPGDGTSSGFQKWEVKLSSGLNGKDIALSDKVGSVGGEYGPQFSMTAVYDKEQKSVRIRYEYIDNEGHWTDDSSFGTKGGVYSGGNDFSRMVVGNEETYGEILKRAVERVPSDSISKEYEIDHWEIGLLWSSVIDVSEIPEDNAILVVKAVYKKAFLKIVKEYYDNIGRKVFTIFPLELPAGTTREEMIQKLEGDRTLPPSSYPGLRFSKWEIKTSSQDEQSILMTASYENCIIRYRISPSYTKIMWGYGKVDPAYMSEIMAPQFCQIAEKGETVSMQREFEGYRDVVFYWERGLQTHSRTEIEQLKTFVVNEDIEFRGDGVKLSNIPKDPEDPENPETPTPADPTTVVDQINDAEAGETIVVDMKDTTVVEKEILEAAKGKDVNLRFDMGSYRWTINGKSIQEGGVKDVNLEVKLDTGVIAESIVGRIAGNLPTRQMSITYDGEFGFTATLSINLGEAYAGKYGNLFYYAGRSRLDFMSAQKVEANGVISVPFTHASDYVFILSDTAMSEKDSTNAGQGTNNQTGGTANTDGKDGKSVATGDTTKVLPFVLMGSMALFILLYIFKKQHAKTK